MPDGMTVRPPLSAEQLGELGYAGPISVPSYDPAKQSVSGIPMTWCIGFLTLHLKN